MPYVDENVPPEFTQMAQELVHDLKMIAQMFGEFKITEEARIWGRAWYRAHWAKPPVDLNTDQFAGYVARKQTHMHKLAMILSASQNDSLLINEEHLRVAADMTGALEDDMPKVFSKIGQTDITRGSSTIIDLVKTSPGIHHTDLYVHLMRSLNYDDFTKALNGVLVSQKVWRKQVGDHFQYYPQGFKEEPPAEPRKTG